MENEDLKRKLEEAFLMQSRIEEKMKFIEENSDNLTDKQLDDLFKLIANIEESLNPEVKDIKKEMDDNFSKIKEENYRENDDKK